MTYTSNHRQYRHLRFPKPGCEKDGGQKAVRWVNRQLLMAFYLVFAAGCTADFSEKPIVTDGHGEPVNQDKDHPESDSEKDDEKDDCPQDDTKTKPGVCGCGVPEGTCETDSYIEMSKNNYAVGETIVVHFFNLPGDKKDWVGLFVAGSNHDQYLSYFYSEEAKNGTMRFNGRSEGMYDARLFFKDSYKLEHEVSFTVGDTYVDHCPDDPNKMKPEICGCGVSDVDSDGDLVADCEDECPEDPGKTLPGNCGCGMPEDCEEPTIVLADTIINTPEFGDTSGEIVYDDACPDGKILVGFAGMLSAEDGYLSQLAGQCATLTLVDTENGRNIKTTLDTSLSPRGPDGAVPWTRTCSDDEVVVGFGGRQEQFIHQLTIKCAPFVVTETEISIGETSDLSPVGRDGVTELAEINCEEGMFATATLIHAKDGIEALGLGCSSASIAPPSP